MNNYGRFVSKPVVRSRLVYVILKGHKPTEIKARIDTILKIVGSVSFVMHPEEVAVHNISFCFMNSVAQFLKCFVVWLRM